MPRLNPAFQRIFYYRIEGDHYWMVPPYRRGDVEWLHSDTLSNISFDHIGWDDLPAQVQREYLLWVMGGKVDK